MGEGGTNVKRVHLALATGLAIATASQAHATAVRATFNGPGVSGSLLLTYGTATDTKYPSAYEITGISGTFTDTNNGLNIINAAVNSLVAINYATPETTNLLAPHDFSRFAVATGLSPTNNGYLTYDNLFWPGGSPQTASDYPPHGGFLDIYGLMFSLGNGRIADLWSNGVNASGVVDYGAAVATSNTALDYVGSGVSATVPEPASVWILLVGLFGLLFWHRRASASPIIKRVSSGP